MKNAKKGWPVSLPVTLVLFQKNIETHGRLLVFVCIVYSSLKVQWKLQGVGITKAKILIE